MYSLRIPSFIMALSLLAAGAVDAQTLPQTLGLGTSSFDIDEVNSLPHTQNATSFTINGPFLLGEGLGGAFLEAGNPTAYDWSGATGFSLSMLVSSTSSIGFTVDFFDELANNVGRYKGSTAGLTGAFTDVTLQQIFQNDMSAVIGLQMTFDDAGSFNTTVESLTALPEPSTWTLLLAGGAILGAGIWRRRLAAGRP